jgi:hypothetical protein
MELCGKAHYAQVEGEVSLIVRGIVVIDASEKGGDDIRIGWFKYRIEECSTASAVVIDNSFLGLEGKVQSE